MSHNEMLKAIYDDMQGVKLQISNLQDNVADMRSELTELKSEFADMQVQFTDMQTNIVDIQLTLENETNKHIDVIADGHLDLIRKLDDALKVEEEKERLFLRVNSLENDVRRIKQKVGMA